jgi:hypothetical protein
MRPYDEYKDKDIRLETKKAVERFMKENML